MNTVTRKLAAKHHIKFKHIRVLDKKDESIKAKGGVTYAISCEQGLDVCKVSTAVCSKQDVFCKETGRRIAAERMNSGQYILLPASMKFKS